MPIAAGSSIRWGRSFSLSSTAIRPRPSLGEQDWSQARAELARRLQLIGLHPPKRAFDIAEPFARTYFDLMPIHRKLRASEFPTLHDYLKVTLCNIHDELTKRLDAEAMAHSLRARAG